jgi:hypothetical protein
MGKFVGDGSERGGSDAGQNEGQGGGVAAGDSVKLMKYGAKCAPVACGNSSSDGACGNSSSDGRAHMLLRRGHRDESADSAWENGCGTQPVTAHATHMTARGCEDLEGRGV